MGTRNLKDVHTSFQALIVLADAKAAFLTGGMFAFLAACLALGAWSDVLTAPPRAGLEWLQGICYLLGIVGFVLWTAAAVVLLTVGIPRRSTSSSTNEVNLLSYEEVSCIEGDLASASQRYIDIYEAQGTVEERFDDVNQIVAIARICRVKMGRIATGSKLAILSVAILSAGGLIFALSRA